jgi:hypothetical protein
MGRRQLRVMPRLANPPLSDSIPSHEEGAGYATLALLIVLLALIERGTFARGDGGSESIRASPPRHFHPRTAPALSPVLGLFLVRWGLQSRRNFARHATERVISDSRQAVESRPTRLIGRSLRVFLRAVRFILLAGADGGGRK